jgi:hypothetical protein
MMKAQRRDHDKRRWREKMQSSMKWKAVCSPDRMPDDSIYYLLNRTTTVDASTDLIEVAHIEIACIDAHRPFVIMVETFHLPPTCTARFDLFISLFRTILSTKKIIQTWGPLQADLFEFIPFGLFHEDDFNLPATSKKNIQNDFKRWLNGMYPHSDRCPRYDHHPDDDDDDDDDRMMIDDFRSCRCLHLMRGLNS